MKPAPQREEALFQAAAQVSGEERASFLDSACRGDPALRQRLDVRLAFHELERRRPALQFMAQIRVQCWR